MKTKNKRNYLKESGITLIALVVTIVVLLILAGVSINALFNDNGIIKKAQEAQSKMNEAKENDEKGINDLNNWIDNQVNETVGGDDSVTLTGIWTQNKTTVTNGTTTYTVGDDYTYSCGVSSYTGGWKILGAENGKLLIMSTVDVGTAQIGGIEGYKFGISTLNTRCEQYGTNARSITVEDINRVTGYTPEHEKISITSENKYYYDNDTANSSSTATGTNAAYAGTYGLATNLFSMSGSPVTGNAYYSYYPNTLTRSSSGTTEGIATDSPAYKLLFREADDSANCDYWLASSCVWADSSSAGLSMRCVDHTGYVGAYVSWSSNRGTNSPQSCVRAVVTIEE